MGKITPINEGEYDKQRKEQALRFVWPSGWYAATVLTTEDGCIEKLSNAGNQMFVTRFQVFNEEGKAKTITSYIMADGAAAWQLRSAAEALGVLEKYRAGGLTEEDLKGCTCYVKLGVETDKTGVYEPKNVIKDFSNQAKGGKAKATPVPETRTTTDILSDEVPF